jgi:dimethylamine monooxygenase subunit A
MGTRALGATPLFDSDSPDSHEVRHHKERLLATAHNEVSVALPGAATAVDEAAQMVARVAGRLLEHGRPPLEAAALLVPDDLVVLVRSGGAWRLAAGVVCFPSHWSLPTKLGLPVTEVHSPVPHYADELSGRVQRFLHGLSADRPVWRRNWTVHASAELHAPYPVATNGPITPQEHWLRSERQVLAALPLSGGILFTIGTQQVPLAVLSERPDVASRLATALRSTPPDLASYRFGGLDIDAIATWLERQAGTPAPLP